MAKKDDIKALLDSQNIVVPFGGTLARGTGDEKFATSVANEQIGGHHQYSSIADLSANMTREVMLKGMMVTIDEHTDSGTLVPKRLYYLQSVPPLQNGQVLDDIVPFDFSTYFKLIPEPAKFEGQEEFQYAPDVNGAQPEFEIGATWYQNGETSSTDNTVIWVSNNDNTIHRWFRKRSGVNANWSIPIRIGSNFEEGQYIDNIYRWVLKTDPMPATPVFESGGKLNNEPTGWDDTPSNYPSPHSDYASAIATHDLWKTSAVKGVYGDLKGPWDQPLKVSADPNLVQYGVPSSGDSNPTDNPTEWHDEFLLTDTHQATRSDLGGGNYSPWAIQKITNEAGRFKDFVFKAFPLGTPPGQADIPTDKEPYGKAAPNNANDTPPIPGENEAVYVSQAEKFNNGELIDPPGWSAWRRWDGQDTIQAVIRFVESSYFRRDIDNNISPAQITLIVDLYRGKDLISGGTTFNWYRGSVSVPNQLTETSNTLVVTPADVTDFQVFTAVVTFEGQTYEDNITLLDLTDGRALVAWIEATSGFTFKNQTGTKTFTPKFFKNGVDDVANVTFVWKVDDVVQTETGSGSGSENVDPTTKVISIQGSDVATQAVLKLEATFAGTTYEVLETLTDVDDGEDVIIEYSSDPITTLPANVANWITDAANANWMRFSTDGGATYTTAIQIRGENGLANAGRDLIIWQWAASAPATPAAKTSGSIIPAGWALTPPADPGGQELYATNAKFTLVPGADATVDTVSNWTQQTSWGVPYVATGSGGNTGPKGDQGEKGWSPTFAVVNDGARRVLRVVSWTGGGGTAPSSPFYVSSSGFTTSISAATDIRGATGPAGPAGPAANSYFSHNYNGTTIKKVIDGTWSAAQLLSEGGSAFETGHIASGLTVGRIYSVDCVFNVQVLRSGTNSLTHVTMNFELKVFGETLLVPLAFSLLDRQRILFDGSGESTFSIRLFGRFRAASTSADLRGIVRLESEDPNSIQVRCYRAYFEVTG